MSAISLREQRRQHRRQIYDWIAEHPEWETAKEAAYRISNKPYNIYYWGRAGKIPVKKFNQRVVFYFVRAVPAIRPYRWSNENH